MFEVSPQNLICHAALFLSFVRLCCAVGLLHTTAMMLKVFRMLRYIA